MNKKILSAGVGLFVVVLAAGAAFVAPRGGQGRGASRPNMNEQQQSGQAKAASASTYTLVQIAAHKDAQSCWTVINGGVYDLTAWIAQHPGGEGAILSLCGNDGSAAFNAQHGGRGAPERALAQFQIGTLAK